MCGIVGIYQKKPINKEALDQMTDIMIHRGPDDRGIFVDQNIGLGHRRLAILDLSPLGRQPMISRSGRYVISYNGEVYNYLELKKKLERRGYKFKSTSDTEVILAAFEEWGTKCLKDFNGMWAFAIYDKKERKFFVARDRLGIKPLYYFFDGEKLILASEIKAILKYPGIKAVVDPQALNEYFTFQNIFSERTLFLGIKLLPAAAHLEYDGQNLKISKWWDVPIEKKKLTAKEWEEKLILTLRRAVKRHLISDVEIGSYLSGGMDSATITALAACENQDLKTFTGGFELAMARGIESTFDERKSAEEVARLYSAEHYEMVIQSGSLARVLPQLIWHLEDPRVGMCYPNFYISALTSKFVKVVLSGAGGDELFGGYPWRYQVVEGAKNINEFDQKYYDYWSRLVKDKQKKEFFAPKYQENMEFSDPFQQYRHIISPVDHLPPVEKALYFELKTFLHGLFVVEDKVSMAHSIEVRVPFLDKDLIELACAMPATYKFQGETGKIMLRRAMKQILPQTISHKKKQGFSPPDGSWYRDENLPYIKETLLSSHSLSLEYIRRDYVKKIINEHASGKINQRLLIWSLLSFEWWCRIFLKGDSFWDNLSIKK